MVPEKKKSIIYISIAMVCMVVIAVLVNVIAHFTKTNNHNETKYGTYSIKMVGWEGTGNDNFNKWAKESLPELNRLGPTFQLVEKNENISVVRIDVADNFKECATKVGIAFETDAMGKHRIIIDPVCVTGELEFKTAFMHEIGHSLGMQHVCRPNEKRSDCSSVGRGTAVMNPNLTYEISSDPESDDQFGPLPTWHLQPLDFKEFLLHHRSF
jgi:hypothetical protein